MNKQIEEMAILARVFCQTIKDGGCCEKCSKCEEYKTAERFYSLGYRKSIDVAGEIFEEIADKLRGLFDFFRQDDDIREAGAIMLAISEIAELRKKHESERA